MDNALRKAIRSILDEMADWSDKGTRANLDKITTLATTPVERDALTYLTSKRCLEVVGMDSHYCLTAKGWDYWEELRCPWRFWFKSNWFPTIVALGTISTSVTSIVAKGLLIILAMSITCAIILVE